MVARKYTNISMRYGYNERVHTVVKALHYPVVSQSGSKNDQKNADPTISSATESSYGGGDTFKPAMLLSDGVPLNMTLERYSDRRLMVC